MNANPLGSTTPQQPTQQPASLRFRPIDPVRVLRANVLPLVIAGGIGIVVGLILWFILKSSSPQFTSTVLLRYQAPATDATEVGQEGNRATQAIEMDINSQIPFLTNDELLQRVIEQPSVQSTNWYQQFETPEDARRALANEHIVITTRRNTKLIELGVWTRIPEEAGPIVDAVADAYENIQRIERGQNDNQALTALRTQEQRLQEDIDRLERQRSTFLTNENIESLRRDGNAAAQEFDILNSQITELKLNLEQATAQYEQLAEAQSQGQVQITPDLEAELEQTPNIARQTQQITMLRENKRAALSRFGDSHPQIKLIDAQITALEQEKDIEKNRLAREMQAGRLESASKIVESIRGTIEGLMPRMEEASRKMIDLTDRLARYDQLEKDLDRQQARLVDVQSNISQIAVNQSLIEARLQFIQITRPSEAELTFPRFIVIVPGVTIALLGLITGVIFVRELLDQRVLSPTDVRMLTRGNLLGMLPDATEDLSGSGTIDRVVERDANGLITEQFRQVRTALLGRMEQADHKSLLMTSPQASAGTTTIAHNLATSLAQNHRRVILLEANFRRPHLAALLGLDTDMGLANVLRGETPIENVTTKLDASGLDVVTAGKITGTVSDLFDGQNFANLIEQLKASYDLIILDAPPALLSSDSQLMARSVDAVAVVLRAGADKRGMADRMIRQLETGKAQVLGIILNWVQSSAGGYFRKNYKAYYDYQGTSGTERLSA
ncbi:polysaccharide biosynthesis tyrosine autokinase [Mucisphaera calidilacus]|uniref:Tyrosine-protein kinase ptk n=1 Tax=Mucisphaera calidilacus TaxID=2527982 RepID=A0A518BTF6_9BACT|nr:polysaccharide biosynthesis tyrosine autokinase [Mucisphaera calidilacus]QDU70254.1 Tyrosine-protein kinase ptk [Mucisphaera calidilacus]